MLLFDRDKPTSFVDDVKDVPFSSSGVSRYFGTGSTVRKLLLEEVHVYYTSDNTCVTAFDERRE